MDESLPKDKKFCECGCGREIPITNRFLNGHNTKGKKLSPEHKKKISLGNLRNFSPERREKIRLAMLGNKRTLGKKYSAETNRKKGGKGEKHYGWKGDDVGYGALHEWIRKRLPKPEFCEICKEKPPKHLANMGIYNREFKNWKYLCIKCHVKIDDMVNKSWITRKKKMLV